MLSMCPDPQGPPPPTESSCVYILLVSSAQVPFQALFAVSCLFQTAMAAASFGSQLRMGTHPAHLGPHSLPVDDGGLAKPGVPRY